MFLQLDKYIYCNWKTLVLQQIYNFGPKFLGHHTHNLNGLVCGMQHKQFSSYEEGNIWDLKCRLCPLSQKNYIIVMFNEFKENCKKKGENQVKVSQYDVSKSTSQSLKALTKSQIKVCHLCVNLDNPCTNSNINRIQTKPNNVSTSHKSS
jgi:hypothetical protein